jgi:hypothetical protein
MRDAAPHEAEAGGVRSPTGRCYSHVLLVTGARTWEDEARMRAAFRGVWQVWGPPNVTNPLLVSGHCPADSDGRGADAMAEMLWRAEGFDILPVPAQWKAYGKQAGFVRNQQMVDLVAGLSMRGSTVVCAAFHDLCRKPGCRQRRDEQLMPRFAGHFSHGTAHCRGQAIRAGIDTVDVVRPSLLPI